MGRKPRCRNCQRLVKKVSNAGFCPACSVRRVKVSIRQLQKKKGKVYKSWKLNTINALKKQPM